MLETAAPKARRLALLVAPILAAASIVSCATSDRPRTGVELTVTFGLTFDAFVVTAWAPGGSEEARVVVPEPGSERTLAPAGETVAVAVSSSLAGQTILVRVDGLSWGDILATAEEEAILVRNELVPLSIHLGPSPGCGDGDVADAEECDDGNGSSGDGCSADCRVEPGWVCQTPAGGGSSVCELLCGGEPCEAGQRCVDGVCVCDGTSCPLGCCDGTTCRQPHVSTCGTHGEECLSCDTTVADGCVGGACSCATATSCEGGLACLDGECLCDVLTCIDGCCDGEGRCVSPSLEACGTGGDECTPCSVDRSDDCSGDGQCLCGEGPSCSEGQRCEEGACVCDGGSCPEGCCDGTSCLSPTLASCGTGGASCSTCEPLLADSCDGEGSCACGAGPACGDGQRCEAGSCLCDAASCAGCCSGTDCLDGTASGACGRAGQSCDACEGVAECTDGVCPTCDATSCADGCCSGTTCVTSSVTACGIGGAGCVTCDADRADGCSAGACVCGDAPACGDAQRCEAGTCVD